MVGKKVAIVLGALGSAGGVSAAGIETSNYVWRQHNNVYRTVQQKNELESQSIKGKTYTFTFDSSQEKAQLICPEGSSPYIALYQRKPWIICNSGEFKSKLELEAELKTVNHEPKVSCNSSNQTDFQCSRENSTKPHQPQGSGTQEQSPPLRGIKSKNRFKGDSATEWSILVAQS
ncbi:hypothetical protein MHLP_02510 [Candidatus Mycoplasma haematolamae str. Purdue]|uniref:Uncharacterized protein n=1 Tax=Mycoplasma haematolamae (strain Purdue) TaxID=1212765 RepID=I7C6F0_MYCHA|nr:hypothetical protein [Candidatus Mycoplasma haematolamae]AFO52082.1 hypothetical protein MHLP_02510 [Candidatus Mycoplasma haematolamae str. Purdue]